MNKKKYLILGLVIFLFVLLNQDTVLAACWWDIVEENDIWTEKELSTQQDGCIVNTIEKTMEKTRECLIEKGCCGPDYCPEDYDTCELFPGCSSYKLSVDPPVCTTPTVKILDTEIIRSVPDSSLCPEGQACIDGKCQPFQEDNVCSDGSIGGDEQCEKDSDCPQKNPVCDNCICTTGKPEECNGKKDTNDPCKTDYEEQNGKCESVCINNLPRITSHLGTIYKPFSLSNSLPNDFNQFKIKNMRDVTEDGKILPGGKADWINMIAKTYNLPDQSSISLEDKETKPNKLRCVIDHKQENVDAPVKNCDNFVLDSKIINKKLWAYLKNKKLLPVRFPISTFSDGSQLPLYLQSYSNLYMGLSDDGRIIFNDGSVSDKGYVNVANSISPVSALLCPFGKNSLGKVSIKFKKRVGLIRGAGEAIYATGEGDAEFSIESDLIYNIDPRLGDGCAVPNVKAKFIFNGNPEFMKFIFPQLDKYAPTYGLDALNIRFTNLPPKTPPHLYRADKQGIFSNKYDIKYFKQDVNWEWVKKIKLEYDIVVDRGPPIKLMIIPIKCKYEFESPAAFFGTDVVVGPPATSLTFNQVKARRLYEGQKEFDCNDPGITKAGRPNFIPMTITRTKTRAEIKKMIKKIYEELNKPAGLIDPLAAMGIETQTKNEFKDTASFAMFVKLEDECCPRSEGQTNIGGLSIYMSRDPDNFTENGIAYQLGPTGLTFNKPATIIYNASQQDFEIFHFADQDFENCTMNILNTTSETIDPNGASIVFEDFTLKIPFGALNNSQEITINKINIECPPSCFNNIQDGDETGVDCGGSCVISYIEDLDCGIDANRDCITIPCGACTNDDYCNDFCSSIYNLNIEVPGVCISGYCECYESCGDGKCSYNEYTNQTCPQDCNFPDTCLNNIKDGDETGVDCGGSCPSSECQNIMPSCFDSIKNQNEEIVDCGGNCSFYCEVGDSNKDGKVSLDDVVESITDLELSNLPVAITNWVS